MLRRNDYIVVSMMKEKDFFVLGAQEKNVWEDGKPTQETILEMVGFVLLDGLDFQMYKFKYENTSENVKKIIEMKTKGLLKLQDVPGFDIENMYNYKDQYMGQNLTTLGDIKNV